MEQIQPSLLFFHLQIEQISSRFLDRPLKKIKLISGSSLSTKAILLLSFATVSQSSAMAWSPPVDLQNVQTRLLCACIIILALSTITLFLRFVSRFTGGHGFALDDALIIVACVSPSTNLRLGSEAEAHRYVLLGFPAATSGVSRMWSRYDI